MVQAWLCTECDGSQQSLGQAFHLATLHGCPHQVPSHILSLLHFSAVSRFYSTACIFLEVGLGNHRGKLLWRGVLVG